MKASEVLKRYAVGERNFRRVNLTGQSFEGKNLSNADFSEAIIHSTNFVDANLTGGNFQEARCGLESRWERLLIVLSFLLAVISGLTSSLAAALVSLIPHSELSNQIAGWFGLSVLIIFVIITIYKGIKVFMAVGTITVTLAGAVAVTIAIVIGIETDALTVAAAITVATALVVVSAVVGVTTTALIVSIVAILTRTGTIFVVGGITVGVISGANVLAVARTGTTELIIFVSLVLTVLNTHIGWRILRGDNRDAWVRSIAIAFTVMRGTSFRNANLTDANFSQAILKSTDFRESNLTRTCWQNTRKLDRVRTGNTYLKNAALRHLLTTGAGQNQNFDRQDLRGVNLSEANLENASFIDADFYQANLQGANLSRAILVRSNFERADLRKATLTGSCIQDWVITEGTKLDEVICDLVFLRWINGDKRDQVPVRENFKEGEFASYVRHILETVELYHDKDIDLRLALTVLKKMSRDYDRLDIVGLGKKGKSFVLQVKVPENNDKEDFKKNYYLQYNIVSKLSSENNHQLVPVEDSCFERKISYLENEKNEINPRDTDNSVNTTIEIKRITYVNGNYFENVWGDCNYNK